MSDVNLYLSICKDADIIPIQCTLNQLWDLSKHVQLCTLRGEDLVKLKVIVPTRIWLQGSNDTFLGHILQPHFHVFLPSSFGTLSMKYCLQKILSKTGWWEGLRMSIWYMIHLYDMNIYTGDIDTILGQWTYQYTSRGTSWMNESGLYIPCLVGRP